MHNDEPALRDALERGPLIEEVGEAIAQCTPPQVFGVHGGWGLGKTSFLHQVQWYLTGDCPQQPEAVTEEMKTRAERANEDAPGQEHSKYAGTVRTVWFDAWRYQNEETPVVALLHEMRAQLSWKSRAANSASRQVDVLTRGALLSLEDLTRKIGFQYSRFRQANREWETENLAAALPSHTLREHLRAAISQLLPDDGTCKRSPRLVVFIDDVDRCEPEAAYRLLEGLKIYLTLDNCVFVLGMNQKAIEEAIAQRMNAAAIGRRQIAGERRTDGDGEEDPTTRAAAYMEKLCQNVWRLPAVRRPERLLHELLANTVASTAVRGLMKRALDEPKHRFMPPNPRRLKGLANLIGRLSPRLPGPESKLDDDAMVLEARLLLIVAYIYQFHHDLHVRWEVDSGLYDRIFDWCRGIGVSLPFLRSLELPLKHPDSGSADSRPSGEMGTTYPDPTRANVFWIQPLILQLEEIAPHRFERYLHGAPAR